MWKTFRELRPAPLWLGSWRRQATEGLVCLWLLGKRHLAEGLSLFAAKKRRKNRHRFDAVDADQGCGPGPGECGHLTTAYSPVWGPVSKENDFKTIFRQQLLVYRYRDRLPCVRGAGAEGD